MLAIGALIWNRRNLEHTARHDVTRDEVQEVCFGYPLDLESYRGRVIVVGPTRMGRLLAVVLGGEDDATFYPITARPANPREQRFYRDQKEPRQP